MEGAGNGEKMKRVKAKNTPMQGACMLVRSCPYADTLQLHSYVKLAIARETRVSFSFCCMLVWSCPFAFTFALSLNKPGNDKLDST